MPPPLNPFLAAFFRSPLATQCTPASNHILLVPSTEVLLSCHDIDSGIGVTFTDLPNTDEFLASHVIRMPHARVAAAAANAAGGKDGVVNLREMRGKAKPYSTFNGRSVVVKDNLVYSNKGFKTMNHAILLSDAIWYADNIDPKPWLIYYISRPLLGSWEEIKIPPAVLPEPPEVAHAEQQTAPSIQGKGISQGSSSSRSSSSASNDAAAPQKKDIKSFHDLLNHFPIIARQMQPGLDKIFREFTAAFDQRFPPPPSAAHVPDPEPDGPIRTAMKKARMNSVVAAITPKPPPGTKQNSAEDTEDTAGPSTNAGPDVRATERSKNTGNGDANGDSSTNRPIETNATPPHGPNSSDGSVHSEASEEFYPEDDEHVMRASLESAITTAIDIFQSVDKQQLSLLGATTDLTGPLVERLIERYVSENVHHLIFPRLVALKRQEDLELEAKIRQMESIDISQLGMEIEGGARNKHDVCLSLGRVVEEFNKMTSCMCPQEMLAVLLATVKTVSQLAHPAADGRASQAPNAASEKPLLTVNADTLVSLLLYIVIRAQMRNLLARFIYMRHFIFIDDVDSGEMGYALSTFEAVLAYLVRDSSGLRRASRRNKALWEAVAQGELSTLKAIMEPSLDDAIDDEDDGNEDDNGDSSSRPSSGEWPRSFGSFSFSNLSSTSSLSSRRSSIVLPSPGDAFSTGSGLGHVFPFQVDGRDESSGKNSDKNSDGGDSGGAGGAGNDNNDTEIAPDFPVKRVKKVAMDTRSMSTSSEISYRSQTASTGSDRHGSGIEGDLSVERLSQTHDAFGESLLMMAVQNERIEVLQYLLSQRTYFPSSVVYDDINHENTTLLSAAVQLGNEELVMAVLDFLFEAGDVGADKMPMYFAQQDIWGRSVAHYLFHAPFLIGQYGLMMPWRQKDKNGQTPLFALCRSYDHVSYHEMVEEGLRMATAVQGDGERLHVDEHVDGRGNTLLHIINDAALAVRILQQCDVNVNAVNDKRFTPLMLASKYGRFDMVRVFFADARVDVGARELRGLTAVELAKDDDVRNKIDDLVLLSLPAGPDGRTTAVVRSYFVEDASVSFVLKSGAAVNAASYAVTTCRRSLTDFEHLTKLLALEHPASWIPSVSGLRSPFQLPSKPSRATLKDLQVRMDWFLRMMLQHPTFSTHEMLWEFILVPDIQPDMMAQRSRLKAETRADKVREELEPLENLREVEQFVDHARELVRAVNNSTKSVLRLTASQSMVATDLQVAAGLVQRAVAGLAFLPASHIDGMAAFVQAQAVPQASATAAFQTAVVAMQSAVEAVLLALGRPLRLVQQIRAMRKQVEREQQSVTRSTRWPLGLLDDARQRLNEEREARAAQSRQASEDLSRELRSTQQTVASELAGWQGMHARIGRRAVRELARGMLVQEHARLAALERALRHVRRPGTADAVRAKEGRETGGTATGEGPGARPVGGEP